MNEKSWECFHYCCMRTVKEDQDFKWIFQPINHFQKRERVLSYENWTWKRMMEEARELDFRLAISPSRRRNFWLIFKEYWKRKCNLWGAFIGFVVLRKRFKFSSGTSLELIIESIKILVKFSNFFDKASLVSFSCAKTTSLIQRSSTETKKKPSHEFAESLKYYHVHHECSPKQSIPVHSKKKSFKWIYIVKTQK